MKEIGGYMEFENLEGEEYYKDLIPLNLVRNAVIYLCTTKKYKKIYVPYFLGRTIFDSLEDYDIAYEYYHINKDWIPKFNGKVNEDECLLIVNYFGQISNEQLIKLKLKYKNIMVDNTESFFQKSAKGVDTLYSCHKNFGVPDGAYLSTDILLDYELEIDTSYKRFEYLMGRYEVNADQFYEKYKKCDEDLSLLDVKGMSKITHSILRSLNYEKIKKVREENFKYLKENLQEYNELKDLSDGTFMYPLLIKNGERIREGLINKKIYIPVFWKTVIDTVKEDSYENYLVNNLLPLPIDHRYGIEEMKYIVEEIKKLI